MNHILYYDEILAQLRWQAQKISELDAELKQLKEDLENQKYNRPIHVDKIEYKFDQLKIETLSGTLSIGISPSGGKQIEEMIIDSKEVEMSNPGETNTFQAVKDEVDQYLASDCLRDLQQFEAKYQVVLGQAYKESIINDIRSQVDHRIQVYLNSMKHDQNNNSSDHAAIVEKVKRDIYHAIEQYIINKKQGGNANENDR